ncbi:putative MFS family arabinose efflux permease [Constrictibacter sp. MBR-5]|jgi:predicted MFS family arabinose efflux permease|uniref:MFS transporter n=1 Tax=Constrictibacter sp. MBR-5 TaxID=3156467 RepID=UPI003395E36F
MPDARTGGKTSGKTGDRRRAVIVTALGCGQIIAWGSTYYLTAVLAGPIVADTGWPAGWVVGALSIGLLISGLVSPRVGHLIDRHGGRPVLSGSALLLAGGLLTLGLAPSLPVFVVGWIVIGVGMGMGLYDPAFSALGRIYGTDARAAITMVTLYGGFASTVCWPFSAFLVETVGWRGTCLTYAAIALAVLLPLYWFGMPREARRVDDAPSADGSAPVRGRVRPDQRVAFVLLAAGFTIAAMIMTVLAVHLLTLLQAQGLTLAAAVALGTLLGPAQVGARILEAAFGRNRHPIWSLLVSTLLVLVGIFMLIGAPGIAAAGIVLYGAGSGIRSIARGTVPLALFGREGYAILMGKLSLPTLVAQAASPMVGALLIEAFGSGGTLLALAVAAAFNTVLVLMLFPIAFRSEAGAPAP